MGDIIFFSVEEAESLMAFIKNHEREDIPDDVWDLCIRLQEEVW